MQNCASEVIGITFGNLQVLWHFMTTIKLTKTLFILTFFALTALTSFGQTKPNKNVVVQILDFDYLEGCETGKGDCTPIEIFRQNKQDSVLLVFPSGGTQSDVYLHSSKKKLRVARQESIRTRQANFKLDKS